VAADASKMSLTGSNVMGAFVPWTGANVGPLQAISRPAQSSSIGSPQHGTPYNARDVLP
jgi:hypothetical protein